MFSEIIHFESPFLICNIIDIGEDKGVSPMSKDNLHSRVLWGSPRIVWCVKLEPVWADFCGARASPNKPTPFLDAVPFTLWVLKLL